MERALAASTDGLMKGAEEYLKPSLVTNTENRSSVRYFNIEIFYERVISSSMIHKIYISFL